MVHIRWDTEPGILIFMYLHRMLSLRITVYTCLLYTSNRDFAYQLNKRGFVTLSIGTKQTTKDKTYSLYYPTINNSTMQPLSVLAYAGANAWEVLARVESVDSTRIGIMGHSYGAKWAMFASCLYEKFACTAWSDPGIVFDETKYNYINYWEPWYLGYYPDVYKRQR